jgi:hypothetical protein
MDMKISGASKSSNVQCGVLLEGGKSANCWEPLLLRESCEGRGGLFEPWT